VFVTRDVTVYAIQPGRGYAQAAAILGPRYSGIVVRDGWAPYRKLPQATHQTCLAHYADLRIMPTRARKPASGAVIAVTGSA